MTGESVTQPLDPRETPTRLVPPQDEGVTPGASDVDVSHAPSSPTSASSRGPTRHNTITSAADALEDEERTRTRLLGLSGFGVNALGLLALPLFGGSGLARAVFVAGLAIHAVSNFGLFYVSRRRELFTERWLLVLWCSSFIGLHLVLYYFGTLTVAAVALVLGLYIVGTTRFERVSLAAFVVVTVGVAVSALLQIVGVIPDEGVVPMQTVGRTQAFAMLLLLEAMFFAVRFIGSQARQKLVGALDQLSAATRAVAHREALLEEAKLEFRRAQRVGGRGRFSDARVGRFELGVVLGRGGMGEIYEAIDTTSGSPAAVKVLTADAVRKEGMLKRFFRECEIVQRLRSKHVVEVLATGGPPQDVPFIAMERLVGSDLASYVSEVGLMTPAEVVEVVRQVGAGLKVAAAAGVVHRDIKPHNIFRLTEAVASVRYKILDFGVSKLSDSGGTLTQGQAIGTPSYMAPEQAKAGRVDHVSDLYSLGAVAYRCVVGRVPFRGDDGANVLFDVVQNMPPRPSSLVDVHPDVDAVFAIAIAKRAGDRFHDPEDFAAALAQASRGELPLELRDKGRRLVRKFPWREPA